MLITKRCNCSATIAKRCAVCWRVTSRAELPTKPPKCSSTLSRPTRTTTSLFRCSPALISLTQLVRLAPDEQRYLERLNLLGGLQEETADDFSAPPEPESDVPQFETFAVVEDEDGLAPTAAAVTFEEFETNAAAAFADPAMSFADDRKS